MKITYQFFKNGLKKAFTMSFDDGQQYDRKLIEIFDKYGIKGTFHINSGELDTGTVVTFDEIKDTYRHHEVACHAKHHPFLERGPREQMVEEIFYDRRRLEDACGYPVRGMSYPFGTYDKTVLEISDMCGISYSRTINSTYNFALPENFLAWHPTCHHAEPQINELFDKFENPEWHMYMPVMYVWGHSYEFGIPNEWSGIEAICKRASEIGDTWFATNIEIFDYVTALKRLIFSADCKMVQNPSAVSVWIGVDGNPVEIKPGELKRLAE